MKRSYTAFVDLMCYCRNFCNGQGLNTIEDIKVIVETEHTIYYESFDGIGTELKTHEISIGKIATGNYHDIIKTALNELGKWYDTNTTLHVKAICKEIKRFDLYTKY